MSRVRLTRPLLPPLEDVNRLLAEVWRNETLSNDGPLVVRLEHALDQELGWRGTSLVASGTTALQLLCRAFGLRGEVLVPALTHPATYQALLWNGLQPVMVDVEPRYMTLDPERAAAAITGRTCGILAVHLFGHPSDVPALERLAGSSGVVLLHDAAAATGVLFDGQPLVRFGHGAAVSLHSTKIFGVGEGGAVITDDPAVTAMVRAFRNFGLRDRRPPLDGGTNGKLSELAAALGLAALPRLADEIRGRRRVVDQYRHELGDHAGIVLAQPRAGTSENHAYLALRLRTRDGEPAADRVAHLLDLRGIESRRYFGAGYRIRLDGQPATPIADAAAADLLCLPLWTGMPEELVAGICALVRAGVTG